MKEPFGRPVLAAVTLALAAGLCSGDELRAYPDYHGIAVPSGNRHAWVATINTVNVFHTSDFGNTWEPQHLETIRDFFDVFFQDSLNGWTAGRIGDIWHTTNGGRLWQRQNLGGPYYAARIRFVNDSVGCAAGDGPLYLFTHDRGNMWDWDFVPCLPVRDYLRTFRGLSLRTEAELWLAAGTDPAAESSYDCGAGFACRLALGADTALVVLLDSFRRYGDIWFRDSLRGVIVGGDVRTGDGLILTTSDAGATWAEADHPRIGFLNSLAMVDSLLGWACGSRGTIVRTWDGGHSWHTCATPVDTTLFDIEFSDREHGMACGPGSVLITTDGTTWRRVNPMTSGIGVEQPDTVFRPLRNPMESPPQFVLAGPHSQFQIDVLDVAGRAVAVLGGYQTPAARLITCPTPLTSGIYFAVLQAAGSTAVRKFTLTGRRLTP